MDEEGKQPSDGSPAGRRKKHREKKSLLSKISIELRKSVAAVFLIGVGIVLALAHFDKAGPAGQALFSGLTAVFGWGYYLLPVIAFIIAGVLLTTSELEWLTPIFLASAVLIISALGLIDIVFPGQGGFTGNIIGLIQTPFGYYASLVIVSVLIIASLLITLNVPLKIKLPQRKKKELKVEPVVTGVEPPKEVQATLAKAEAEAAAKAKESPTESDIKKLREEELGITPKTKIALKDYILPPLSLLKSTIEKPTAGDLRTNANIIKRTMESFGIAVEMGEINIGPKFTRYTLKPAEGVKLSRVTGLNQDLALALAAHPIRIEAPIPGKSLVGIEVPNKSAAVVRLGSLLAYPEFNNSGPLGTILGRDVTGEPILTDIARMPHLLIAGATGSGKSVVVHSLLTSLLYKNPPHILKMILIDPKKVELSSYDGIPHLIAPVVIEGKKAVGVFRWAVQEMEKRYETLLKHGCRNIGGYNDKNKDEPMPYLVIVVDEMADLMAAYGKDVETAVVRLAQMARATGIHLVLATQRPSVEVITGLIKANITSRIALQVASQIDSRTVLDSAGAEKLLGGGDLLFVSADYSKPKRIQGAYVSESEVGNVCDFIRENNLPAKISTEISTGPSASATLVSADSPDITNITEPAPPPDSAVNFDNFSQDSGGDDDELYDEAVQTVREAQKASASLLQRRLKVGYARAARLLDIMETKGVVGPGDGAKPREVFLSKPEGPEIKQEDF